MFWSILNLASEIFKFLKTQLGATRLRVLFSDSLLATHKTISKITQTPKNDWLQLLISPDSKQYVEIIFIGEITLDALECIRITNKEYMQMWELAFANFGRSQSEAERAWIQDFNQLLRADKDGKIQLKVIT